MSPESEQLYALAAYVAAPFIQLPQACAAMVTGSVAKGLADVYSDIDMSTPARRNGGSGGGRSRGDRRMWRR